MPNFHELEIQPPPAAKLLLRRDPRRLALQPARAKRSTSAATRSWRVVLSTLAQSGTARTVKNAVRTHLE